MYFRVVSIGFYCGYTRSELSTHLFYINGILWLHIRTKILLALHSHGAQNTTEKHKPHRRCHQDLDGETT